MRFFTKSCISIFLTMSMLLSSSMAAVAETEGETTGTATSAVVEISADIEDKEEMETQILPVASGSQDYMLVMQELRKLVDEYDGKIIYKDFSLPLEKENGVVFSYEIADEESRNYISLQDGTVHITHPAAGMGVKTAVLSVTVQRGDVSIPYEISIKIADEAFVNPFGEESLKKVIALCEQTIGEQKAADNIGTKKAGQLSPDKLEALEIALEEAKACTDVPEMPQHTKALIDAGVAFMGSGVIDNTVLYKSKNPYLDEGDTIVYSVHRAKLERLLWKAKALLLVDEGFYAKSTKEALRAEMKRAELALARDKEGRSMFKLPYVKTRMFVKAPSDYMIQFVIRHKTRIYLYNGFSLGDGFEPVLDWYERDGIMYPAEKDGDIDLELLREHVTKLVDNQRELFTDADTYEEDKRTAKVGAFRKKEYDGVLAAMEEVESEIKGDDVYGLALAAVRFLDAAYDCRMTIALLSDIDVDENGKPRGNLFFTGDEVEDLRKRIKTNDFLKQGYEQIKDGLKGFRADAIEDYWERWKANDQSLWDENPAFVEISQSTGGKFKSGRHVKGTDGKELPANMPSGHTYTGKAYITLELAKEDNDTTGYGNAAGSGCGEVWLDQMAISSDEGNLVYIPNSDFELQAVEGGKPLNWKLHTTGKGEGRWESNRANVSSGNRSLYFHNPDGNSTVTWTSDAFDLPISSSTDGFDISYRVKQYGIFESKGIQVKFHFITRTSGGQGEVVSAPIYFNAKASPYVQAAITKESAASMFLLTMQRAGLMAMLAETEAERIEYARIAKASMFLELHQMNQGIENWLKTDDRPDGIDAFGAVQTGRSTGPIGTIYSIIKDMTLEDGTPLFSEQEKKELTENMEYNIRNLNDLRDCYHLSKEELTAGGGGGNWSTDMNMGAALASMAFHDTLENAKTRMYNGIRFDEAMLEYDIGEDGSFPESVRYHNAAISKLAVLAKGVLVSTGITDWFSNEKIGFQKSFDYLTWIQTPRFSNGNAATPTFGDHRLEGDGSDLYMCGMYYDQVAEAFPDIALRMYGTWINSGYGVPYLNEANNLIQLFFGYSKDINEVGDYKEAMKEIGSTDYAKYWGMYIFRNNFMVKGEETYLNMIVNRKTISHGHEDQMSFLLYADNIPLVIDPGIAGYWDGARDNYKASTSHSLVSVAQNAAGSAWYSSGTTSKIRDYYTSDSFDMVRAVNTNHGELYRDIAFVKNGFEAFVIWDQVSGAQYGTMMNLPLLTSKDHAITRNGNKITADMFGGIDLEITCLEGNYESMEVVTLKADGEYPLRDIEEKTPLVDHLRIKNKGDDGYLTVLFPKTKARGSLTAEKTGEGIYKLTHSSGNSVYIVVNEGTAPKTVVLPENNLIDMESLNEAAPVVYRNGIVQLAGRQMKVLTSKVTTTQKVKEEIGDSSKETLAPSQWGGTTGSATSGVMGGAAGGDKDQEMNDPGNDESLLSDADSAVEIYRSLAAGQRAEIKYRPEQDIDVSFQSGNQRIAAVSSNGMIKARKSGKTVISVLVTKDGVTEKVSINLTVKTKKKVPKKIRRLGTVRATEGGTPVIVMEKALEVSGKSKIHVVRKEDVTLRYQSSDTKIAVVNDQGIITGKKAGTANIIAAVKRNDVISKYLVKVTVK